MYQKCWRCGYVGEMKSWLRGYNLPQFMILLGLFFMLIPSLLVIAYGWGKVKCPRCGLLQHKHGG